MVVSDLREQVQSALGSAFLIDRELTGGGMSRVFVATETALGRKVVVKVLHPELAADVTAERFGREIQLVARLQQANIVPLLTTGHTGTLPFYTMPFVEGLSLRQRLSDGVRVPVPEAVNILRDVARALAYAHDAGVVHRDIKPENVLISGGAAVVTDFGIAKAVSVARTQAGTGTITQAGVGIGTPAYMAPEQAIGDPTTDHRADIYAFGCLAYELLAGRPPFEASGAHELVAAQISATPVTVETLRPDTPPGLAALVMRCLEKLPTQRPQSARELLDALESVNTPTGPVHAARTRGPWPYIAAALVVTIVVAVPMLRTREPATPPGPPAIAIIPFTNIGGDSAQDYLADGLSDELATSVGKIPGVKLSSRSASYRYRGRRDIDVREVGKTLGVAYVVQGSVRRSGDQMRVSAQLTDAVTGVEAWSQSFDRTTKDVFRTEDEITGAIANALAARVRLAGAPSVSDPATRRQGTTNADAYDRYLRAEYLLLHRQVDKAAEAFEGAIALDASFARAHAGLAKSLSLMPYFSGTPVKEIAPRLRRAAGFALAADSSIAEAYTALGMLATEENKWDEARRSFEKAVAADPNDVETRFQFGRYWLYVGNDSAAFAEWNRTKQIDPFSSLAAAWTASLYSITGRTSEALVEARRALDYDSTTAVVLQLTSRVYQLANQYPRAVQLASRMSKRPPWIGMEINIVAKSGDVARARAMTHAVETESPRPWFTETALCFAYLALGDTAKSLSALERATDAGEHWPAYNRVSDPIYDSIRKSARWAALLKRVGLEHTPGALK